MMKGGFRLCCGGCVAALALLSLPALVLAGKVTDNAKDGVKVLEEGKLTLAKVIEAAEADSKGKACCVMVTKKDAGFVFSVHTNANGKCSVATVDKSGKAMKADAKPEECKEVKCADAAKLLAGKTTLAAAVAAAEADTKGKASAASAGADSFAVAVVADGKVWNVTVDKDGKVTKKDEIKPVTGG